MNLSIFKNYNLLTIIILNLTFNIKCGLKSQLEPLSMNKAEVIYSTSGYTRVHELIHLNQLEKLKIFHEIVHKTYPNLLDLRKSNKVFTPLQFSVINLNLKAFQFLLYNNADPNLKWHQPKPSFIYTTLSLALITKSEEQEKKAYTNISILKKMINILLDPNRKGIKCDLAQYVIPGKNTALHYSAMFRDINTAKLILEYNKKQAPKLLKLKNDNNKTPREEITNKHTTNKMFCNAFHGFDIKKDMYGNTSTKLSKENPIFLNKLMMVDDFNSLFDMYLKNDNNHKKEDKINISSLTKDNSKIKTCNSCNKIQDSSPKQCGRCKKVYYCNKECQRKDWKTHKQICKKSTK